MRPATSLALCLLFLAAQPAHAQEGGCDNYGTIVQVGVENDYECTHMTQYCHQGTGAGAGAGAGGPGQNEAGASATAGTKCNQDGGRSGQGLAVEDAAVDLRPFVPAGW